MEEQKEPELTLDLLTKHTESPYDFEIYNYSFSNKAIPFSIALQRLQTIANTEPYRSTACVNFVNGLMEWAPQTQPPLVIEKLPKNYFFYNGDVYMYKIFGECKAFINGDLKIKSGASLDGDSYVWARRIDVQTINAYGNSSMNGIKELNTQKLNIYNDAIFFSDDLKSEVINVHNNANLWCLRISNVQELNSYDWGRIRATYIDTQVLNACGQSSISAFRELKASVVNAKDKAEVNYGFNHWMSQRMNNS